jgi:hypothetical protein
MSTNWYQQALTPPEVLEGNLRIGWIPSTDHVQVLVELKDPVTGIMIAQESCPSARTRDISRLLEEYAGRLALLLEEHGEPF